MTHVRALWVLGTLLVGCSSYEPNGVVFVGGESCPAPQFDSLDDAGVEGRSALEALQWIEEHWASRQVAWRGGGRATVEVAVTVPDDAEFYMLDEADCDADRFVGLAGLHTALTIEDVGRWVLPSYVKFSHDRLEVRTIATDPLQVELDASFSNQDADEVSLSCWLSDSFSELLVVEDASGVLLACEEEVDGNCLAP